MKLPPSFADIRGFTNDLHTFIGSHHFAYGGGLFRVAMTTHEGTLRFTEGCLLFQREKIACTPKTDYGDVLFLEEWVEPLSSAESFLAPFLSGQRSIAGQKITTQFTRTDCQHQNAVEFSVTGWREWRFLTRADFLDRNETPQVSQEPLTRNGLPPYLNPGHAIAHRVFGIRKWQSISSPYLGHFMTLLPETRARLLAGEWRPGSVHIQVEANDLSAFELQLLIERPTHRESKLIAVETREIEEVVPLDSQSIDIFLVEQSGECLGRAHLSSVFSAFGPDKPGQETYQRILGEISNGENDHVEYKVFIEPRNTKEREIIKAAIAFANTSGGSIYVGVEDDGSLQGEIALCAAYRSSPEKAKETLGAHMQRLIVEGIKPVPNFTIDLVEVRQCPILAINIERGRERPYSNRNHETWIRKGASDMVPDPRTELPRESEPSHGFPFAAS
jgi:Schlafen, AlbA_2